MLNLVNSSLNFNSMYSYARKFPTQFEQLQVFKFELSRPKFQKQSSLAPILLPSSILLLLANPSVPSFLWLLWTSYYHCMCDPWRQATRSPPRAPSLLPSSFLKLTVAMVMFARTSGAIEVLSQMQSSGNLTGQTESLRMGNWGSAFLWSGSGCGYFERVLGVGKAWIKILWFGN